VRGGDKGSGGEGPVKEVGWLLKSGSTHGRNDGRTATFLVYRRYIYIYIYIYSFCRIPTPQSEYRELDKCFDEPKESDDWSLWMDVAHVSIDTTGRAWLVFRRLLQPLVTTNNIGHSTNIGCYMEEAIRRIFSKWSRVCFEGSTFVTRPVMWSNWWSCDSCLNIRYSATHVEQRSTLVQFPNRSWA